MGIYCAFAPTPYGQYIALAPKGQRLYLALRGLLNTSLFRCCPKGAFLAIYARRGPEGARACGKRCPVGPSHVVPFGHILPISWQSQGTSFSPLLSARRAYIALPKGASAYPCPFGAPLGNILRESFQPVGPEGNPAKPLRAYIALYCPEGGIYTNPGRGLRYLLAKPIDNAKPRRYCPFGALWHILLLPLRGNEEMPHSEGPLGIYSGHILTKKNSLNKIMRFFVPRCQRGRRGPEGVVGRAYPALRERSASPILEDFRLPLNEGLISNQFQLELNYQ